MRISDWSSDVCSSDLTLPLGTLAANLVGGYGVGLALRWFAQTPGLSPELRLFVIPGLLGGLTTFSTFSLDTVQILLRQQYSWAGAPVALHVLGSLSMTVLGRVPRRGRRARVDEGKVVKGEGWRGR